MIALAAALGLAGCGEESPVAEGAKHGAPAPGVAMANDAAAAEMRNRAATPSGAATAPIPAALHGRWGLTPADCDAPPGQAEGLLVVSAEKLLFHESVATPASSLETSGDSISGEFLFTGEGERERRFQSLQLQDRQLIRSGNGPAASFTYVRCGPGAPG